MTGWRNPITWALYGLGTLAVAGIVHLATILALPTRATNDAFTRIAALGPPGALTAVSPPARRSLPFSDAAMRIATCRYDLAAGPLRISIDPFDADFISLGMHGRSGRAFYGLNLASGSSDAIALVLMDPAQAAKAEDADDDTPSQDLRITAPEAEGFVLIELPDDDPAVADAALRHVHCSVDGAARPPS